MATLSLFPKRYYLGIGCKKDTRWQQIEELIQRIISDEGISFDDIAMVTSIDIKSKEYGLNEFAQRHGLPFVTFSSEQLMSLQGDFTQSDFVRNATGTDNVCERSAVYAAGENSRIIVRKTSGNGVTAAIAFQEAYVHDIGQL